MFYTNSNNLNINLKECTSCLVRKNIKEFSSYQKGKFFKIFYKCNECLENNKKISTKYLIFCIISGIIFSLAILIGIIVLIVMTK